MWGSWWNVDQMLSPLTRWVVQIVFMFVYYSISLSIKYFWVFLHVFFWLFDYLILSCVLLHKQCSQTISISNDYMLSKSMSICHTYCTTIKHLDRLYCIVSIWYHLMSFNVKYAMSSRYRYEAKNLKKRFQFRLYSFWCMYIRREILKY